MKTLALKMQAYPTLSAARLLSLAAAAILTSLTLVQPEVGAASIYVAVFILIAFKKPAIAMALTFASAPFQNDLSQGGSVRFSIAEINLGLTFITLLLRRVADRKPIRYGPALLGVFSYFAVCIVSTFYKFQGLEATVSILQMFLYLVVAVVTFSQFAPTPRDYLPAFWALIAVCVVLAAAQALSPGDSVSNLHKNGIGSSLSCGLIVGTELFFTTEKRRKALLLTAILIISIGLLSTLSRGAWLAAFSGCAVIAILRNQTKTFLKWAAIAALLFLVVYMRLPGSSQQYTLGFDAGRENIRQRLLTIDIASALFQVSPIIGNGVGIRKDMDATNLFWMTLAETGLCGMLAFISMHCMFLRTFRRGFRAVPKNSMLASLFVIGSALLVSRVVHGMVDHYWSRGALMLAWAAAGMAMGAYFEVKRHPPGLAGSRPHL